MPGPIAAFLAFLVLFTGAAGWLMISAHGSLGGMLYLVLYEWTPCFAALAAMRWYGERAEFTVRLSLSTKQWLLSYALPLTYILPVYVLTWLLIQGSWRPLEYMTKSAGTMGYPMHPGLATFGLLVPLSLTVGLLTRFPYTSGEELGWRGYLFPSLQQRYGFVWACLLTGAVWATWHYPLLYAFGLFSVPHAGARMSCFTLMVIGLSFVFGWLWMKTKSLSACVLMHTSHNAFLQTLFDPLTHAGQRTLPITSEFGYGLMLMVCVVALYLALSWKREK